MDEPQRCRKLYRQENDPGNQKYQRHSEYLLRRERSIHGLDLRLKGWKARCMRASGAPPSHEGSHAPNALATEGCLQRSAEGSGYQSPPHCLDEVVCGDSEACDEGQQASSRPSDTLPATSHDHGVVGTGRISREVCVFQAEQSFDQGLPVGLGYLGS